MPPREIRVRVFLRAGRNHYEAQWEDPITGRKRTRTTGCSKRVEAIRFAAKLEQELVLRETEQEAPTTWQGIVERYKSEVLAPLRISTQRKAIGTINKIADLIDPKSVDRLTASVISRFAADLRKESPSEFTVKGHLRELRKLLNWCQSLKWIREVPAIPKRLAANKGRPITTEEFERLLSRLPEVVKPEHVNGWFRMLVGLWWSGLRLSDALQLHWTNLPVAVELGERRAWLRVAVRGDKANQSRLVPVAPEFEMMLRATPEADRYGLVFDPRTSRGCSPDQVKASKIIAKAGRLAGIKVGETTRGKLRHASAHDLRRSFGDRWARRQITPAELKELMRHASLQTTLEFYALPDAEKTATAAHAATNGATATDFANILANICDPEGRPTSSSAALHP